MNAFKHMHSPLMRPPSKNTYQSGVSWFIWNHATDATYQATVTFASSARALFSIRRPQVADLHAPTIHNTCDWRQMASTLCSRDHLSQQQKRPIKIIYFNRIKVITGKIAYNVPYSKSLLWHHILPLSEQHCLRHNNVQNNRTQTQCSIFKAALMS